MRPAIDESVDFENTKNLFIEGDNLEALKLLQETYLGKVKMIYIDPPYNTGNDFVYEDDFAENTADYLQRSNQKDESGNRLTANPESNGRFHSDWLSMMYPRLKLARNLLRDDGVIFISIDDNEQANLKRLCDEVFGEGNFCGIIHRRKNRKPHNAGNTMSLSYEFILVYYKSNHFKLVQEYSEMNIDEKGNYAVYPVIQGDKKERIYNFNAGILVECKNFKKGLIKADRNEKLNIEILDNPIIKDGILQNNIRIKGRFRLTNEDDRLEIAINEGRIYINSNGFPKEKRYRGEFDCKIANHHWDVEKGRNEDGNDEIKELFNLKSDNFIFNYPKPVNLIKKAMTSVVGIDFVILDFFAGSSTTAHAVMQLNAEDGGNRKFIMVQLPEACDEKSEAFKAGYKNIAEKSKERIRRAGKKILEGQTHEGWNKDVGFRVLKVDTSNMADVYYTPDGVKQNDLLAAVDNIKPDRQPEDLLFQVLLDLGVDLSLPISKKIIQGKTVFFVNEQEILGKKEIDLIACFDGGITEELVKEIAKTKPMRAVGKDNGFVSDSVKINAQQIFKQISPSTDIKAI